MPYIDVSLFLFFGNYQEGNYWELKLLFISIKIHKAFPQEGNKRLPIYSDKTNW